MKRPPGSTLTLAQLRALEAVARLGSFSSAAKALGLSQPSVSNHVIAAEAQAGAKLLTREGHSARPAPILAEMLPQIRAVLALCADIEHRLGASRTLLQGSLRIGYSTFQIAMPAISRFMARHPGISIEARAMASLDVLAGLEDGRLEVGFITDRALPADCAGRHLVTSPIVLIAPPDHPLARRGRIGWGEVANLPLIQREGSSGTRKLFEGCAKLAQVDLNTVLALGSWGSIVAMVREGVGLGVAMRAELGPTDGLTAIEIDDPALIAQHFVVCQPAMARVAAVEAFLHTASSQHDSPVSELTS